MSEWKSIEREKPEEHYDVIVARDHFGDKAYDYFIATYWDGEEEWNIFMTFPCPRKNSNHVRLTMPIKCTDKWKYFKCISEEDDGKE